MKTSENLKFENSNVWSIFGVQNYTFFCKLQRKSEDFFLRGDECVGHQGADGHGAYTAGNGGDIGAVGCHFVELDVAAEAEAFLARGIGHARSTYVYYYCSLLDHVGGDELRLPDGGDDDVGLSALVLEGDRAAVAYGDGGVAILLLHHELCHGLAHDIAAAEDDALLAGGGYLVALEQLKDALGGG